MHANRDDGHGTMHRTAETNKMVWFELVEVVEVMDSAEMVNRHRIAGWVSDLLLPTTKATNMIQTNKAMIQTAAQNKVLRED